MRTPKDDLKIAVLSAVTMGVSAAKQVCEKLTASLGLTRKQLDSETSHVYNEIKKPKPANDDKPSPSRRP